MARVIGQPSAHLAERGHDAIRGVGLVRRRELQVDVAVYRCGAVHFGEEARCPAVTQVEADGVVGRTVALLDLAALGDEHGLFTAGGQHGRRRDHASGRGRSDDWTGGGSRAR